MSDGVNDLSSERSGLKVAAWGLSGCLLVYLLATNKVVEGFALLGAIVTGWQIVFFGGTLISHRLNGPRRMHFNVLLAIAFPLLASLYFLADVQAPSPSGLFGHLFSLWFLVPAAFLAWIAWKAVDQIDRAHPFRGFIVAATILWVVSFMWRNGFTTSQDDYDPDGGSTLYADADLAASARETGRYFGQYLVYVAVCYGAMFFRLRSMTGGVPRA